MNIALVCDDLIQFGGAEKIVEELSDMFPQAPIYTSIASDEWVQRFKLKGRTVKTSFLQSFPFFQKIYRYIAPFLLYTLAFESFDFTGFDIVLSSSSRFAHHIITKPETVHICYMHSPGRMIWETKDYFENEQFGHFKKFAMFFLAIPLQILRIIDYISAQKVDKFIANSLSTQEKIKKYYNRESQIVYPFVDVKAFKNTQIKNGDYFLVLTRLLAWKHVDIAILACNELGLKLKIIGDGPDIERLKAMSGSTVEFLGRVSDEEKKSYLSSCVALIETQKEDFGIVPLEAMACGKPIIAYNAGGARETVIPKKTGEFFNEQTPTSLKEILKNFNSGKYLINNCYEQAARFSKESFEKNISEIVKV